MKKYTLFFMIGLFFGLSACGPKYWARQTVKKLGNPQEKARTEIDRLSQELGLNQLQREAIYNFKLKLYKESKEWLDKVAQNGGSRSATQQKIDFITKTADEMILLLLGKEQKNKYKKNKSD